MPSTRPNCPDSGRGERLRPALILDVALDAGFGDVSNFNHAFRAEFGISPRAYRQQCVVR
jgi:AraC-like DNA-binding protein